MIASVQPSMDASSNSSARRRVAGGLRLRLRVGIGHEHTHTHWKTNPYDSNPFLFSAKRRDQGGHKEVPYTCCPYLGLACSANANAISLAAFTTSLSSKRPKRPGRSEE